MSFSEHHFSDLARLIFFRLWLNYKQSCLIDIWLKVNYSRKKISLIEWLCVIEAKFVGMASLNTAQNEIAESVIPVAIISRSSKFISPTMDIEFVNFREQRLLFE